MTILEQAKLLNRGQVQLLSLWQKVGIGVLCLLSILSGFFFIDSLLAPPSSVATIDLHAANNSSMRGQNAIELSFWLAVLGGNLLSFRTMEVFFRQGFGRFVRDFPLKAQAVFLNRFRHSLFEGMILTALGVCFFVPLFTENGIAATAAITTFAVSMLVAVPLSIASFLYIGSVMSGQTNMVADGYGGGGGAFIYGPILGFAVVAFTSLGIKLGAGELLFRGTFSNAFFFIFLIVGLLALGAFRSAYVGFGKHYYHLLAKFNEADSTVFDLGNHYQTSDYPGKGKLASLATPVGPLARNYQLQYQRRFPIQRSVEKISILVLIIFFATRDVESIPLWAITLAGTLLFGALSNPWYRISGLPGRFEFISLKNISDGKAKLAMIEVLPFALLSALIPAVVLLMKFGVNSSIIYAGCASALIVLNLYFLAQLQLFGKTTRFSAPILIGISVAFVAFLGPMLGAILSLVLCVGLIIKHLQNKNERRA